MAIDQIVYTYTGKGLTFLPGIPARDLSIGDISEFTQAQIDQVESSGLYEVSKQTTKKSQSDAEKALGE